MGAAAVLVNYKKKKKKYKCIYKRRSLHNIIYEYNTYIYIYIYKYGKKKAAADADRLLIKNIGLHPAVSSTERRVFILHCGNSVI